MVELGNPNAFPPPSGDGWPKRPAITRSGGGACVSRMQAICDEFEAYGYRRVGAELHHQGVVVNHKKIRRLMREHDLQPKRRRRYVTTTDSDHDSPIFPNRARDLVIDGPTSSGSRISPISRSRAASSI